MIGSNLLSGVRSAFRTNEPHAQSVRNLAQAALRELPPAELYAVLRALYNAVGLFDELRALNYVRDGWAPALKGIANPTHRAVEFFANRTLRGDLEIVTENERIIEPLAQVFKWSNMANLKTVISRVCARDGDAFLQVVRPADRDRVYFQLLDAAHVTDFDDDNRQNITWLRLEKTAAERDDNGELKNFQHVECWSKPLGTWRRWRVDARNGLFSPNRPLNELGPPAEELTFEQLGIGWVPIVHAKHRDIDEPRGVAAIMPAYDLILEACLMATRLHQLAFRHANVTQAIQSAGRDAGGRTVMPPVVNGIAPTDDGTVTLGGDTLLRFPAGWELVQLVPQLPYAELLALLTDQMARIEDTLPVLVAFKRLREMGEVSGRAARLLLGDAAEQVEEAGGNLEGVVIRASQMALTIGAGAGIFRDLGGSYESGAFEHSFAPRDIFPLSDLEISQGELAKAQAFQTWRTAGLPVSAALERSGIVGEELQNIMDAMVMEATALDVDDGAQ